MDYQTIYDDYGYGWGRYGRFGIGTTTSRTTTTEWEEGTLLIDIIDGRNTELMWRSVGQAKLSEQRRTPEEAQERANEVAAKMLADFPPGGGSR